jgi:hypothetical protein
MHRKHPKARRATALTLLTSLSLVLAAASAVALHPSPVIASTSPPVSSSRTPLPGDPNTPDEGGRTGTVVRTTSITASSSIRMFIDWVKGFTHHYFLPPR